jgi:hypothetical protein
MINSVHKTIGVTMKGQTLIRGMIAAIGMTCLCILALTGCDSKSKVDDNAPPTGTTIGVTVNPGTMSTNTTTVVVATVETGGTAVPNQEVTFTVSPANSGYFTPAIDTTDANGEVASVFTATTSGTASINATISGSNISRSAALSITDASSGNSSITMTVTPSLMLANGADTAQVTIVVRDANGQAVADSTMVKITAGERFVDKDGNGYWSNGIDSLVFDANANSTWDAIGFIPSSAKTGGGNGSVTVNYIAGNDALTVYVKVTVDENGVTGSKEATLQLAPNTAVNSIFLASDSMNLTVKQTGGIESAHISATCFDINGNAVPEGISVSFIITDGPGGGEHLGIVGYGPYGAVTNSQGVATAPIHAGTVSGTIRVRAFVDTVLSNATQVMVSAGPPAHIVIGSEVCNAAYWDNIASTDDKYRVAISGVISDVYLNPVTDNTVVYFSTDEGTMKSHELGTKSLEGRVGTWWYAGNNVATADGIVMIYAETAGGTVADTSFFYNTHDIDTLVVTGFPASIPADGITEVVVWVTGFDLNGNPVANATAFFSDANYVTSAGSILEDGCGIAQARVKITSSTLQADYSLTGGNDDGIGATDAVIYWGGDGYSSYPLQLRTGVAYGANSSMDAPSSVTAGSQAYFSATIRDRFSNPLGDHTLNMTASKGVVVGASQETNTYGEAFNFRWTPALADTGDVIITITDTDPRGGIILSKKVTVSP